MEGGEATGGALADDERGARGMEKKMEVLFGHNI
jgi:hypothetical protein